jgi:hypothetical protein
MGVAALGTALRAAHSETAAFDNAGELVIGLAVVLFLIAFALA